MEDTALRNIDRKTTPAPAFVEESFDRITDSRLIRGCGVRLLRDAAENYPAWAAAIESASERIFFESYIIHGDEEGERFADLLIKKASEGVAVRLIYDWMGGFGKTPRRFWRRLREGGVEVRCYNPPRLLDPLGILSRDHRKCISVDGRVAYISGLCVGRDWVGRPEKGIPPWRDTGVEITGRAAVRDVEKAFAEVWAATGEPLEKELTEPLGNEGETDEPAGDVALRIIDSVPSSSYVYRVDQFLAAGVRESMWLSDAYFIGIPSYLQSIRDAAEDGVDVRLLLPRSTDIAVIRETTRTTYRHLLEAGVRVYEWDGSMMHAKTAVFDGRYSRVGSTNLNIASWFGNYELDVLVEDERFGREMREMFLADLGNATEVVLGDTEKDKFRQRTRDGRRRTGPGGGSVAKATAGALSTAASIGSAITRKTRLGAAESKLLFIVCGVLSALALLFAFFPRIASVPLVLILLLLAYQTFVGAVRSYRKRS